MLCLEVLSALLHSGREVIELTGAFVSVFPALRGTGSTAARVDPPRDQLTPMKPSGTMRVDRMHEIMYVRSIAYLDTDS